MVLDTRTTAARSGTRPPRPSPGPRAAATGNGRSTASATSSPPGRCTKRTSPSRTSLDSLATPQRGSPRTSMSTSATTCSTASSRRLASSRGRTGPCAATVAHHDCRHDVWRDGRVAALAGSATHAGAGSSWSAFRHSGRPQPARSTRRSPPARRAESCLTLRSGLGGVAAPGRPSGLAIQPMLISLPVADRAHSHPFYRLRSPRH